MHHEAIPNASKSNQATPLNQALVTNASNLPLGHEEQMGTSHKPSPSIRIVTFLNFTLPSDGKDSSRKTKGITRDRVQAIFNKRVKLSNTVNEADQAFKPVIRDMFALSEFYQQVC